MNGKIVNIVMDKGFFFIKGEDGRQYFAHKTALVVQRWIYDIEEDDRVEFDPDLDAPKGPRAESIMVTRLQ